MLLAALQFAAPALLGGLGAAALPLLIHLLLRPRARRVRFPPVSLLYAALASGQRAQRWRNVVLLLLRCVLLACIAVLLARPTCAPAVTASEQNLSVAAMLVVDDSWSTQYALEPGRTIFSAAREAALHAVRAAADWPQPSTLGLVWADPQQPLTEPTGDYSVVRLRLTRRQTVRPHANPLGHALRQAAARLQAARQPRRRLIVFTDQAAHAWRDVPAGLLSGIENLRVQVHCVGPATRSNIALTGASGPTGRHPESAPVPIQATVGATGLGSSCSLVIRDLVRPLARIGPLELSADSRRDVSELLPPRPRGAHALIVRAEPADRLNFDQQRYVAFQTAERPTAWLITAPDADPEADLTALLIRNLLAPETLPDERQLVSFAHLRPGELVALVAASGSGEGQADAQRGAANLVVVLGGVELSAAARQALSQQAERGATVLLLPGSGAEATDWPGLRPLLADELLRVETLDAVVSISWERGSTFADRGPELDELTRAAVRRRALVAGLAEGVRVEARYTDGVPAIVGRPWGRGRLLLLTTSPDPAWSELGLRAAGLLTWLHTLLQDALPPPDRVAMFTAGQATRRSFAGLPDRGIAHVVSLTDEGWRPVTVRVANAEPGEPWPTALPGLYEIRTSDPQSGERIVYAVNWPAEESNLRPIGSDRLAALLGISAAQLQVTAERGDGEEQPGRLERLLVLRDPARGLPLLLLAVVVAELLLANRRRPTPVSA